MKVVYTGLMVAGLVLATGCNQSTTGGKAGEPHGTFKLTGPSNTPETTVKHGESVTKEVSISAGSNFKEDITFDAKVDPADKGVTATVEPKTWKGDGPKKVELHIKADDKAKEGEYTIHVTGKPAKGDPTTVDVKIKVPEKK